MACMNFLSMLYASLFCSWNGALYSSTIKVYNSGTLRPSRYSEVFRESLIFYGNKNTNEIVMLIVFAIIIFITLLTLGWKQKRYQCMYSKASSSIGQQDRRFHSFDWQHNDDVTESSQSCFDLHLGWANFMTGNTCHSLVLTVNTNCSPSRFQVLELVNSSCSSIPGLKEWL